MWMSERKEKRNRYKVIFFFSRNSIVLSLNDNLHFIIRRFPSYFFFNDYVHIWNITGERKFC